MGRAAPCSLGAVTELNNQGFNAHPNPAKQLGVGYFFPCFLLSAGLSALLEQEPTLEQFVLRNSDPPGSLFAATCSHVSG